MITSNRFEPHLVSQQEFSLQLITEENLFAETALTTTGIEGTLTEQVANRPVGGGVGDYFGATGACRQSFNGVNNTILADGTGENAPNFLMEFDLLVPR